MKLTGKDLIITAVSVATISVTGTALYRDFNKKIDVGKAEKIGTITFKKKTAQRKYTGQVIWENLTQSDTIYNYDTIRTDAGSLSIIKLKDGSTIELNENTLILLALTENKTMVNFSQGSINATGSEQLNITAGKTVINAAGSSVNLTSDSRNNINLNVNSGTAILGDKKVTGDQVARIAEGATEVTEREFNLMEPAAGRYLLSFTDRRDVTFSWKSLQKKEYIVEIASDPSFRKKIVTRLTGQAGLSLKLPAGTWFWRVGYAVKNGKLSEPQAFNIVREQEENLITPVDGAGFKYVTRPPLVPLRWTGSSITTVYNITLASDPAFANTVKTVESRSTSIAVDNLPAGTYYWRVNNVYPFPVMEKPVQSEPRSFVITKKEALTPPVQLNPPANHRVSSIHLTKGGQLFNWQPDSEMKKYIIRISRDRTFKQTNITGETAQTFYQLSRPMERGTWYWRVEGLDQEGNAYASQERSFVVTDTEAITTASPADGSVVSAPGENAAVNFTWNDPNSGNDYLLEISGTREFTKILSSHRSGTTSVSVKSVPAGDFFWRVALMEGSRTLVRSNTAAVRSAGRIEPPAVLTPADGSTIDMTFRDNLIFSWKKVPTATHYRIIISQYTGGFSKKIIEKETRDASYVLRQLELLDEGNFSWEIQALRYAGASLEKESALRKNYFSITLKKNMEKPEIISPQNLYIK